MDEGLEEGGREKRDDGDTRTDRGKEEEKGERKEEEKGEKVAQRKMVGFNSISDSHLD